MIAWLEVAESRRVEVRVAGDPDFVATSENAPVESNIKTLMTWAGAPNTLPDNLRTWLSREPFRYEANDWAERVEHVSIRHTQSDTLTARYTLAGTDGQIAVNGWNGAVAVNEGSFAPFRALKSRLRLSSLVAFVSAGTFAVWFASRHWYFVQSVEARYLAGLALMLPLAIAAIVVVSSRPKTKRQPVGLALTAIPALVILALQGIVAASAGPSVARGEELRSVGNLQGARREFLAAAQLGRNGESAEALHDDVQLEILQSNRSPTSLWSQLPKTVLFDDEKRRKAEANALELTAEVAGGMQEKGQYRESLALLNVTPPALRGSPAIHQRFQSVYLHNANTLWQVIHSKKPNKERLSACEAIRPLLKSLDPQSSNRPPHSTEVAKTCSTVQAQEVERVRRDEDAARTATLRAARAAEAAERSAERDRES